MTFYNDALSILKQKIGDFRPKFGLVLGSGLGPLADEVDVVAKVPYEELPGFFTSSVEGHAGEYIVGFYKGVEVICMSGRVHLYEGAQFQEVALPIRIMKGLGIEHLIVTGAAGSLNPENKPGDVVLIKDHINLQPGNPLVGPNDDLIGPRFVPMEEAYDKSARVLFKEIAQEMEFDLPEGVYLAVLGPSFETPAEIRAFKLMGADVVAMSVVPEVIIAKHCGLKVTGFAAVTNMASGITDEPIAHEDVLVYANKASEKLIKLVGLGIERLALQLTT
ncbi:MAG: purine-nucleoside phosphorylase [Gammaproteobacteria bacterium]|nr:MAG: purine-nucleoside phosphorylase [Gammaproteobacteria bacterium]UTW42229.1 purine-nucleoside phosphorylase [bacterium SCSIO 12844]